MSTLDALDAELARINQVLLQKGLIQDELLTEEVESNPGCYGPRVTFRRHRSRKDSFRRFEIFKDVRANLSVIQKEEIKYWGCEKEVRTYENNGSKGSAVGCRQMHKVGSETTESGLHSFNAKEWLEQHHTDLKKLDDLCKSQSQYIEALNAKTKLKSSSAHRIQVPSQKIPIVTLLSPVPSTSIDKGSSSSSPFLSPFASALPPSEEEALCHELRNRSEIWARPGIPYLPATQAAITAAHSISVAGRSEPAASLDPSIPQTSEAPPVSNLHDAQGKLSGPDAHTALEPVVPVPAGKDTSNGDVDHALQFESGLNLPSGSENALVSFYSRQRRGEDSQVDKRWQLPASHHHSDDSSSHPGRPGQAQHKWQSERRQPADNSSGIDSNSYSLTTWTRSFKLSEAAAAGRPGDAADRHGDSDNSHEMGLIGDDLPVDSEFHSGASAVAVRVYSDEWADQPAAAGMEAPVGDPGGRMMAWVDHPGKLEGGGGFKLRESVGFKLLESGRDDLDFSPGAVGLERLAVDESAGGAVDAEEFVLPWEKAAPSAPKDDFDKDTTVVSRLLLPGTPRAPPPPAAWSMRLQERRGANTDVKLPETITAFFDGVQDKIPVTDSDRNEFEDLLQENWERLANLSAPQARIEKLWYAAHVRRLVILRESQRWLAQEQEEEATQRQNMELSETRAVNSEKRAIKLEQQAKLDGLRRMALRREAKKELRKRKELLAFAIRQGENLAEQSSKVSKVEALVEAQKKAILRAWRMHHRGLASAAGFGPAGRASMFAQAW